MTRFGLTALAVLPLAAGVADAQDVPDFESLALESVMTKAEAVADLAWPFVGSCAGTEPGFDRIQCTILKKRARAGSESTTYRTSAPAVTRVAKGKLTVFGCVHCPASGEAVSIGSGRKAAVDGRAALPVIARVEFKGKLEGPVATEFLFRLSGTGKPSLVAFRTFDECSGAVLASDPPSGDRNPTKNCSKKSESDAEN